MKIHRPNHTQVPNSVIDTLMRELSPAEFKVFIVVCRKTIGWHKLTDEISITQFMEITGLSNKGVINAIRSLESQGLIIATRRDRKCTEFTINYESSEISSSEASEVSSPTKENSLNKDYIQFVTLWNQLFDTNLRITEGKRRQINARLNRFSEDELKQALKNRSQNDWIMQSKYKGEWDSFWRNDEKVERYLNQKQEETLKSWQI